MDTSGVTGGAREAEKRMSSQASSKDGISLIPTPLVNDMRSSSTLSEVLHSADSSLATDAEQKVENLELTLERKEVELESLRSELEKVINMAAMERKQFDTTVTKFEKLIDDVTTKKNVQMERKRRQYVNELAHLNEDFAQLTKAMEQKKRPSNATVISDRLTSTTRTLAERNEIISSLEEALERISKDKERLQRERDYLRSHVKMLQSVKRDFGQTNVFDEDSIQRGRSMKRNTSASQSNKALATKTQPGYSQDRRNAAVERKASVVKRERTSPSVSLRLNVLDCMSVNVPPQHDEMKATAKIISDLLGEVFFDAFSNRTDDKQELQGTECIPVSDRISRDELSEGVEACDSPDADSNENIVGCDNRSEYPTDSAPSRPQEFEKLLARIEELEKEHESLLRERERSDANKTRILQLEEENKKLHNQLVEVKERQMAIASARIADLQKENSQVREQLDEMKKREAASNREASHHMDVRTAESRAASAEIEALKTALEDMKAMQVNGENKSAKQVVEGMLREIGNLRAASEENKSYREIMERNRNMLEETIQNLQDELQECHSKCSSSVAREGVASTG